MTSKNVDKRREAKQSCLMETTSPGRFDGAQIALRVMSEIHGSLPELICKGLRRSAKRMRCYCYKQMGRRLPTTLLATPLSLA